MVTCIDKSGYRAISRYGSYLIRAKDVNLVGQGVPGNCGEGNMDADAGRKHAAILEPCREGEIEDMSTGGCVRKSPAGNTRISPNSARLQ